MQNRSGKYVTWSSSENNYTLLNFWASWDKASVSVRDSLAKMVKEFPERNSECSTSHSTTKKEMA